MGAKGTPKGVCPYDTAHVSLLTTLGRVSRVYSPCRGESWVFA